MKKNTILCLIILGIPILLGFVSTAIQGWHYVFDDSFIAYRYAKNLALGYGITWNPGYIPTEGYTNFLLVVLLAPFIKIGLDPLLVTRVLSYLSVVAMSAIIFAVAKHSHGCPTPTAFMIAALILLAPQTRDLCLVGLETVIYSLFLLMTFHMGIEFLHSRQMCHSILCSLLIILTMLFRPEAALLYPVMLFLYAIRRREMQVFELKPLIVGSLVLLALGGAYLVWKALHFGYLLPNPFYIKASNSSLISPFGARAVASFISTNFILLALSCASLLVRISGDKDYQHKSKTSVVFGLGIVSAYTCFFIRTDTLMDISGRFMYPLLPILIYMTIPCFVAGLTALESRINGRSLYFLVIVVAFLLAFGPQDVLQASGNIERLVPNNEWRTSNSLMQREFRLANDLAAFPDIENVRIAFGDSGVIPYITGSVWLDVVGLNDGFIARTRDKKKLVDYFFQFRPDVVIHPGGKDYTWITYGHGPLGDYNSWAEDPRWNDYTYVGTIKTSGELYDLQFFVRASSPHCQSLTEFLRRNVIDGWYEPFPFHIGTYEPNKEIQPIWYGFRERNQTATLKRWALVFADCWLCNNAFSRQKHY